MSTFIRKHGDLEIEIKPIPPHTEQEVRELMDSGDYVGEIYPKQVIRSKSTDEEFAEFKFVS